MARAAAQDRERQADLRLLGNLKVGLDLYAALHCTALHAYGETVDATTLISHMLEAFMAGNRGFRKGATPLRLPPRSAYAAQQTAAEI